jgi:hypothetical protein
MIPYKANEQDSKVLGHRFSGQEGEHEEVSNAVADFLEEGDEAVYVDAATIKRTKSVSSSCCPICLEEGEYQDDEEKAELAGVDTEARNRVPGERRSSRKTPFLIRGAHCSHGFCRTCLEKLLLTPPTGISTRHEYDVFRQNLADLPEESSDRHSRESSVTIRGVPTQGSCPMCRARLSLFDLRWLESDDNESNAGTVKLVYVQEIETDWTQTPLVGKVFAPKDGVGWGSFHFEPADSSTHLPYFDLENVVNTWTRTATRIAAEGVPAKRTPLRQIRWHGASLTLNAVMKIADAKYDSWEVILCFSASLQFIRAGAIVKKWKIPSNRTELHRAFPLDGKWAVTIHDSSELLTILVVGNSFAEDGQVHLIRAHLEESKVSALETDHRSVDLHADWDWRSKPTGPADGETIHWTYLTGPHLGKCAQWTLIQKATKLPPPLVDYLGGASGRDYRLRISAEGITRAPPTYHAASLWGNVFCQAFKVGLASYHFPEPRRSEAPYISYEHPATSRWPPLDDGTPVPSRVSFRDVAFDGASRTFRGTIRWLEDYGTTWQYMKMWEYEIRFDERFTCIVGGHVASHYHGTARGGIDQVRELSRYGEDLVYINAALYENFLSALSTVSGYRAAPGIDAERSSFERTHQEFADRESQAIRQRLMEEGASVRTIAAVHRVWTAARRQLLDERGHVEGTTAGNPVDFNQG